MKLASRATLLIVLGIIVSSWLVTPSFRSQSTISIPQNISEPLAYGYWLDISSNSYAPWRIDPLLKRIAHFLQWDLLSSIYFQALVFFVGLAILLRNLKLSSIDSLLAGFSAVVLIAGLFGANSFIWGSLVWIPWTLWGVLLCEIRILTRPLGFVITLLSYTALCFATSGFAPIATLCTLIWASIISNEARQQSNTTRTLLATLCLIILVGLLVNLPELAGPDYPPTARVVSDDGLAGIIRPLVGSAPIIPFLDRSLLTNSVSSSSWLLILGALALLVIEKSSRTARGFGWCAALCGILTAWQLLPYAELSEIGPLASISRIIPGVFQYNLASPILAFGCISLICSLILAQRILICALIILLYLFNPFEMGTDSRTISSTPARLVSDGQLKAAVQAHQLIADQTDLPSKARLHSEIFSPSWAIIQQQGFFILQERSTLTNLSSASAANFAAILTSSHRQNQNAISRAIDHDLTTRWTAKQGGQQGDEWLRLNFPAEVTIRGIELATGSFHTDFPRSLRVEQCDTTPHIELYNSSGLQNTPLTASWEGAIVYTPMGYPYYAGQNDVRIFFPREVSLTCLTVYQTGVEKFFDWSVAEVNLLLTTH